MPLKKISANLQRGPFLLNDRRAHCVYQDLPVWEQGYGESDLTRDRGLPGGGTSAMGSMKHRGAKQHPAVSQPERGLRSEISRCTESYAFIDFTHLQWTSLLAEKKDFGP